MTQPRWLTVDPTASLIYHCYSRCARSLGLVADATRVAWLIARLRFLASIFAIDVCEYAIMDNHVHVILRPQPELAWSLSDEEIAHRWLLLRGKALDENGMPRPEAVSALAAKAARIDLLRRRLADLGWFHKELKEPCARKWNREERVRGAFWDGRYGAKVADTDVALVNQAIYVLLNRIRCGAEEELGQSGSTSLGERLSQLKQEIQAGEHADAAAAFENRFAHASWTPVFPCDPGSVRTLDDSEYALRVSRGIQHVTARAALADRGMRLVDHANGAAIEEVEAAVTTVTNAAEGSEEAAQSTLHLLAAEGRGRRGMPSPKRDQAALLRPTTNPFASGRGASNGSIPILPGMQLAVLIRLTDEEGRRPRPDKPCRIASARPPALESFRAQAIAASEHASTVAQAATPTPVPFCDEANEGEQLSSLLRQLVDDVEAMAMRHRVRLAELCEKWRADTAGASGPPQGAPPVRWRGTVTQPSSRRPRATVLGPVLAWS